MIDDKVIHNILQKVNVGIWTIEIDENKLPRMYADETMLRLIEMEKRGTPEEVYEKWYENIERDSYPVVMKGIEEAIKDGKTEISYAWKSTKRGKTYVRCGGSLDPKYNKGIRISGYHQDITEVVVAKKEKEWLKDLNTSITNSLGKLYDGIYRVDVEKEEIIILKSIYNESLVEKKIKYEEFIKNLEDNFQGENIKKLKKDFSLEKLRNFSSEKDGLKVNEVRSKKSYYEYSIFFQKDNSEKKYIIITLKNIANRKKIEEENTRTLKEAYEAAKQANISKTSFLSRMSHDIRTPINVIVGMTNIAMKNLDDRVKIEDSLTKVLKASDILLELINQVLDMSKIENENYLEKVEVFNLKEFVENLSQIYGELSRKKRQEYLVRYEGKVDEYVKTNVASLQRIFTNVVSNAIKYTPNDGKIEIILRELPGEKRERKSYQLEVRDNGIGISKEFMEKIYEPFSREKNNETGVGLGMSIVHNLVSMLNGNIDIESEIDKGTTVYITLELEVEKEDGSCDESCDLHEEKLEDLNLNGKKILLVEDNELNREIAYELLKVTGAQIVMADNGKRAVELFNESGEGELDLILMDIQMPVMDGYVATKNIRGLKREDSKRVKIVAMSANTFLDDIQRAKHCGMNDYISKPIDIKKLIEVLKKI